MSHLLHGFTDPKYLDVLMAKAEAQLSEAQSDEDRQRFAAYLDVLKAWKERLEPGADACAPGVPE